MSQTPEQICPQCQSHIDAGQRFCPNCGTSIAAPLPPTTLATPPLAATQYGGPPPANSDVPSSPSYGTPSNPNLQPAPSYGTPSNPNLQQSAPSYGMPSNPNLPPAPSYETPSNPNLSPPSYSTPSNPGLPPQQPVDPYKAQYNPGPPPPMGYGQQSNSGFQQPPLYAPGQPGGQYNNTILNPAYPNYRPALTKKRSPWPFIIIGIIVVLVLACGGSILALSRAFSGPGTTNTNPGGTTTDYATSQTLNLSVLYASDQITFTDLKQAPKFADDSLSAYSAQTHPNFVRASFKEQQNAKHGSIFSYLSNVHLILPDKNTVTPVNAQQSEGPDTGIVRTNWIDFPTNGKVDLSKLAIQMGSADEAQMTIPLKNGANLSQYNPKVTTLNKQTKYAEVDWTLKDATESLSFDGQQAKSGQVYITINLSADNNSDYNLTLFNFARLKTNGNLTSADIESTTDKFNVIDPHTTNLQGSLTFLVTPPTDGKYTLDFIAGTNITEQTVDFQIS